MMEICKADFEELNKILELQYLAYKSEAASFGTNDIPPLKQTMEEVIQEYRNGIILKMISEDNDIIGSVRAREDNGTAYIGKLMVHPDYRCCGCGTKLLMEIEKFYPGKRYELYTSTRGEANIRLYQRNASGDRIPHPSRLTVQRLCKGSCISSTGLDV
jgi:ribosomal protein S18 acetylase RimI-like enzyme